MSDSSSQPDWRDPFAPEGAEIREPGDQPGASSAKGVFWVIALCTVAVAIAGATYFYLNPASFAAHQRTITVGLPETVSMVFQVEAPATFDGLDAIVDGDMRGLLQNVFEGVRRQTGIQVAVDQVEVIVVAADRQEWLQHGLPPESQVQSMCLFIRFKTGESAAAVIPAGTPVIPGTEAQPVYDFDPVRATRVDDRTWLICGEGLLDKAQDAYREDTQPGWVEAIESDEPLIIAGRITGTPGTGFHEALQFVLSGAFGDPSVVSGQITAPQLDQAQQILNDLQRQLDADFGSRGPLGDVLFSKADLALRGRTVTFEGSIPAAEVEVAMAPVILGLRMLALASAVESPQVSEPEELVLPTQVPDTANRHWWELLQVPTAPDDTALEPMEDSPAPPEGN